MVVGSLPSANCKVIEASPQHNRHYNDVQESRSCRYDDGCRCGKFQRCYHLCNHQHDPPIKVEQEYPAAVGREEERKVCEEESSTIPRFHAVTSPTPTPTPSPTLLPTPAPTPAPTTPAPSSTFNPTLTLYPTASLNPTSTLYPTPTTFYPTPSGYLTFAPTGTTTASPTESPTTTIPPFPSGFIICPNARVACNCRSDCFDDADKEAYCSCAAGKRCCAAASYSPTDAPSITAEPSTGSPTESPTTTIPPYAFAGDNVYCPNVIGFCNCGSDCLDDADKLDHQKYCNCAAGKQWNPDETPSPTGIYPLTTLYPTNAPTITQYPTDNCDRDGDGDVISDDIVDKLALKAGISGTICPSIYEETNDALKVFLTDVIKDAVATTSFARRKTVIERDIIYALEQQERAVYGFGSRVRGLTRETQHHKSTARELPGSDEFQIKKLCFQRLVREIAQGFKENIRFQESAVYELQEGTKAYIVGFLQDYTLCAIPPAR